jgi:hypothetical protein
MMQTSIEDTNTTHNRVAIRRSSSGLWLLAGLGLLLLLGFVVLFLLLHTPSLWVSPTLVTYRWPEFYHRLEVHILDSLRQLNGGGDFGVLNSRLYHAIIACLFVTYFLALYRAFRSRAFSARSGNAPLKLILLITAAILAVLLFSPGAFTGDLFSYVWYGRVFAMHGGNPYIDVPSLYAAEDTTNWLYWLYWQDLPSPYGPVWTFLAGNIAMFSRVLDPENDLVTHLLGHKLLACVVHLVNIWMVWNVARLVITRYWPIQGTRPVKRERQSSTEVTASPVRNGWSYNAQVGATLTYAWNPLLLLEFGMSGHNDELAILTLLAALWLHMAGKWRWAVLALALGTLVKVTEGLVFLVPYLGFLFWETRKREGVPLLVSRGLRLAKATAIVVVAWVVAWLPFWEGPATVQAYTNNPGSLYYINSIGTVIRYTIPLQVDRIADEQRWAIADSWDGQAIGDTLDKPTRYGLQAIAGLVALFFIWRARTFRAMLVAIWWMVFAYLAIGSIWFWPWYTSWLLVPMALLGPGRLYVAGQIMCVTSLLIHGLNPQVSPVFGPWWEWSGLIINAPPMLYLLGSAILSKARQRKARLSLAPAT